jgi:hypothetical protein
VNKVKIGTKTTKCELSSRLREDVSQLVSGGDEPNIKRTESNLLAHKVKINLDMLRAGVEHGIGRQVRGTKVVTPQDRRLGLIDAKLLQHRLYPNGLSSAVGEGLVLRLRTRTRNRRLLPRTPRHQIRTEEHCKTASGSAIIRTASPIGIGENTMSGGGGTPKTKTSGNGASNIPQDALNRLIMSGSGLRQVLTDLVDSKRQVRTCESQILKTSNKTPVLECIL